MSENKLTFHHIPVLFHECMEGLAIKPDGIYVDGTLGGGGHSSGILSHLTTGHLYGIDRDGEAIEAATEKIEGLGLSGNFTAVRGMHAGQNLDKGGFTRADRSHHTQIYISVRAKRNVLVNADFRHG